MSETDARLFVAAEIPDELRAGYAVLREDLARDVPAARWVRPEGMHLTFKFLGRTPRSRIQELGAALGTAASGAPPLRLATGPTGIFGSPQRPRVLWLAVEGEVEGALALAARIEAALSPLGFPQEDRAFHPHLTLARFGTERKGHFPEKIRETLERALARRSFSVDGIVLFESIPGRGGARYEALRTCALSGGGGAPAGRSEKGGEA